MKKSKENYLIVGGKELSAGVVLTDGSYILGCLPFGRSSGPRQYDLPKGHVEVGEKPKEAAIREMAEETGIHQQEDWLIDVGQMAYTPKKNLHLFLSLPDALPATKDLRCSTYFEIGEKGKQVPEIIGYKWIPTNELHWFFPRLEPLVATALRKLENL